jgi:predicted RNA-binding Zn ribbon-like protein
VAPDTTFRFTAGRSSLDLVATVGSRLTAAPVERLTGPDAARRWLGEAKLPVIAAPGADDVADLKALREAMYQLLEVNSGAAAHDARAQRAVELVNELACAPIPEARLALTAGGLAEQPPDLLPRHALTVLARDFVSLFNGTDVSRIRQCGADICGTYFLDTNRGEPRRWCNPRTCGNRERVATHRARHRASADEEAP